MENTGGIGEMQFARIDAMVGTALFAMSLVTTPSLAGRNAMGRETKIRTDRRSAEETGLSCRRSNGGG